MGGKLDVQPSQFPILITSHARAHIQQTNCVGDVPDSEILVALLTLCKSEFRWLEPRPVM
jgi:hypothetical protein